MSDEITVYGCVNPVEVKGLICTGDVTKAYVDGSLNLRVLKAGDTMTGMLVVPGVHIGNASDYISIDASGDLKLIGGASQWNDIRFPATQAKKGSNDLPHFDYANLGLLFPQNDESEKIYMVAQFNHDYKLGSSISPHIHYRQTSSSVPTFVMQYRWYDNGEDCSIAFTTIESSTNVLPYTSGSILNMIEFPEIAGTGITGVSSIMDIIIYRKTGDGVSGDVLVKEFDIHYEADSWGSNSEYIK